MNDKFDELAKGLAQSASRALLCLALAALIGAPARATDFKRGPLVQISGLSLFSDCILATPPAVNFSKSSDCGFHWTSPITLDASESDGHAGLDKDSITADPIDARFVYAAWEQISNVNPYRRVLKFARTTDAGATWEIARQIFD